METVLREIFAEMKEQKKTRGVIDRLQSALNLMEDVERLSRSRGMVGVQEAIEDGVFPEDAPEVDFFQKLLMENVQGDHEKRMEEMFLAKYVYDKPAGVDAFIDYAYSRTASRLYDSKACGLFSVYLCSLLPEELQKEIEAGDFLRKSCFEEFEQKCSLTDPPCQELKKEDAIASRDRLENLLKKMDPRAIQRMLRDVENGNLGIALKGCHPEMAMVVLENLSKRLRAMILEDMEFMGPLREVDIMESMDTISELIEKLEKSGEIVFSEGGE